MVRLLIVSKSETPEVVSIVQGAQAIPDLSVVVADVTDVDFDFSTYDVVYWRSASVTATIADAAGRQTLLRRNRGEAIFLNNFLDQQPHLITKSVQQAHVASSTTRVPGIPTFLFPNVESIVAAVATGALSYPLIAKPNRGCRGQGIVLIAKQADIAAVPEISEYIFQPFIENSGDYRVIVVGGVPIDVVKRERTKASTTTYLNNVSQGAVAREVPKGKQRDRLLEYGGRIAALFTYHVCGIDFIVDDVTGTCHFMEINSVPQWELYRPALAHDVGLSIAHLAHDLATRQKELLVSQVQTFFDRHVQVLPISKRFHYVSRMWLAKGGDTTRATLNAIRSEWLPDSAILAKKLQNIPTLTPPRQVRTGKSHRVPHLAAHYKINPYNEVFFKMLFLEVVYNEDTNSLRAAINPEDIKNVVNSITEDEAALFALSTWAVNFLYHAHHFLPEHVAAPNPAALRRVAARFTGQHPWSLDSEIYLLTHAIIGASRFYAKPIDSDEADYHGMLDDLEQTILKNFPLVSLDHKFEFLVCAKLLGRTSILADTIWAEAAHSLSPLGNYFVDTFNVHSQRDDALRLAFHRSEHRNVLALIAAGR